MTTVLVVDDQALIRRAVIDILSIESDVDVIGEAADGRTAVGLVTELQPDIVVMDIRMPELDGIAATTEICAQESTQTRVLILTTFEEDEYLIAALRAGASGFVGKGAEPDEIVRAVRSVHAGDALLSPQATRSLIDRFVAVGPGVAASHTAGLDLLTEREREVLLQVARGRSNSEIGADLFISPHTAKTHVNRIMTKLNAHDRAQLVIFAYESGLLAPGL